MRNKKLPMKPIGRIKKNRHNRGVAFVVAMIVMAIMAVVSMALSNSAGMSVHKAMNHSSSTSARLAAESGMTYALFTLRDCQSDPTFGDLPNMMDVLQSHLVSHFEGNENLPGGWAVQRVGETIIVPPVPLPNGWSFGYQISVSQVNEDDIPTELTLVTNGQAGDVSRRIGMKFDVEVDKTILTYAVATVVRSIIRGNGTTINGDIACSWRRPSQYAWPLDIGHKNSAERAAENIQINGAVKTILSEDQFNGDEVIEGQPYTVDCMSAVRHEDIQGLVEYDEPNFMELTWEDFDTSMFRDRPEAPAGEIPPDGQKRTLEYPRDNAQTLQRDYDAYKNEEGQWLCGYETDDHVFVIADVDPDGNPCDQYRGSSGYVRLGDKWVTIPPPDNSAPKVICEYWANGYSFWRAFYEGFNGDSADRPVFTNLHIPQGSHAYFRNCTFTGITYIGLDEDTDLPASSSSTYTKYNNLRYGLDGAGGSATNTNACNNVVFENCTFDGPIVTGVPKDYRYWQNSMDFHGETVFNTSAIREELAGTTLMAPNYNINIGDFEQGSLGSESELVGILVGGIVDIRDNATVNGTILSMANLDHVSDYSVHYWGSNIGNWEDSGEHSGDDGWTASTSITITPDPENVLPLGMSRRYKIYPKTETYTEYSE